MSLFNIYKCIDMDMVVGVEEDMVDMGMEEGMVSVVGMEEDMVDMVMVDVVEDPEDFVEEKHRGGGSGRIE